MVGFAFSRCSDEGTRFVTRAKYAISFFNMGHGSVPFLPMPFLTVAATMSVRGGVGADMAGIRQLRRKKTSGMGAFFFFEIFCSCWYM